MSFVAGQKVRASDLNAGQPLFGRVTSDVTVISSTTLVDVTGLVVAMEASAFYTIEGFLGCSSALAADLKFAWTMPAGCSILWTIGGIDTPAASPGYSGDWLAFLNESEGASDTLGLSGGTSPTSARPMGSILVGATAGNLQMTFAQVVSTASNTTVKAGSWLKLTRVA